MADREQMVVRQKALAEFGELTLRSVNPGPKWGHCPACYGAMIAGVPSGR